MADKAAQNNFCPHPDCGSRFRTMDGLHDHIDSRHDGESLNELRAMGGGSYGFDCPVGSCPESFTDVDSVVAHVAGKANGCDEHAAIRDSAFHDPEFYLDACR